MVHSTHFASLFINVLLRIYFDGWDGIGVALKVKTEFQIRNDERERGERTRPSFLISTGSIITFRPSYSRVQMNKDNAKHPILKIPYPLPHPAAHPIDRCSDPLLPIPQFRKIFTYLAESLCWPRAVDRYRAFNLVHRGRQLPETQKTIIKRKKINGESLLIARL